MFMELVHLKSLMVTYSLNTILQNRNARYKTSPNLQYRSIRCLNGTIIPGFGLSHELNVVNRLNQCGTLMLAA